MYNIESEEKLKDAILAIISETKQNIIGVFYQSFSIESNIVHSIEILYEH